MKRLLIHIYQQALRAYHDWRYGPRAENPYPTHLPILLALARLLPIRRVAEFGCGTYSTPTFLDRRAFPELTTLDSYETDVAWLAQVQAKVGADPRINLVHVNGPMAAYAATLQLDTYDLIFIDDSLTAPERAATIRTVITTMPTSAQAVVVIHDYEAQIYQQAAQAFPQRFMFTAFNPHTGVVWRAAPLSTAKLQHVQATLKRHARTTQPEDIVAWQTLLAQPIP